MVFSKNPVEAGFLKKLGGIFFVLFLIQFLLGVLLIYQVVQKETESQLSTIVKRVQEDITFKNGKWDTSRYNADPDLPGTYPLYVLATDGFVIDRWKPLHGFLDTSDAKRLLSYTTTQTISTDTNQSWRVLSKPITSNGQKVGVLTVASFNPQQDQLQIIDSQLTNNANFILSKVSVENGTISTKNLDVRDVSYDVIFQIVDQYNRIITKTDNTNSIDRIPNFIDTSYIGDVLQGQQIQHVTDAVSGEKFLVFTQPIVNSNNYVIGVIVAGKSITFLSSILRDYLIAEGILGIALSFLAFLLTTRLAKAYVKQAKPVATEKLEIQHISFDKKSATLFLDKNELQLPYATNQYYLCETLFSNPKKRWELDELLEKFGEVDSTNWRKVYDATLIVNKKVSEFMEDKLIVVKDKTYQINPQLISKLS